MAFSKQFTAIPPPRTTAWASVQTWEGALTALVDADYTLIDARAIAVDLTPLVADPVTFDVDTCVREVGLYRFRFLTSGGVPSPFSAAIQSPGSGGVFCTPADVATRTGMTFTTAQAATVTMLCASATTAIADAVDRDAAWANALIPVPGLLRVLAIELVARSRENWGAWASTTETLGAYSYTQRANTQEGAVGMMLTEREERMARRVVWGALTASAVLPSIATIAADARPNGDSNPDIYGNIR